MYVYSMFFKAEKYEFLYYKRFRKVYLLVLQNLLAAGCLHALHHACDFADSVMFLRLAMDSAQ